MEAALVGHRVHLRVIDRGPGVSHIDRDRVFQPFQRLGDHDNHAGSASVSPWQGGFVEAVDGTIVLDDTPGGGLTVLIDLPGFVSAESSAGSDLSEQ